MLKVPALLLAAMASVAIACAPAESGITVSAASSLTDALEEIAAAYSRTGGRTVQFNFAGSNTLARHIVSGAPVDLFISADEAQMTVAQAAGAIDESTKVDLLGNQLAVVTPRGTSVSNVRSLLLPRVRRIAVGDTAAVPAGVYARRYLEAAGLWHTLQPKLVQVASVRAALAAVQGGSVDAAIVYVTDAAIAPDVTLAFTLGGDAAPRIVYPAAVVRTSKDHAAAARFLLFLRGPEATAIFLRHKFVPLSALPD